MTYPKVGHTCKRPHEHVINELGTSHWASLLKDAIPQYCNLRTKPLKHVDPWMAPESYPNHSIKEVMRQEI